VFPRASVRFTRGWEPVWRVIDWVDKLERTPMTEHSDLTPRRLRTILGHFATGLTVITAATKDGPAGFTCQSFSSLSLEPALVTFSPARTSRTWPLLRETGRFTINILPAEHQHLAGKFARSGTDKFAGVDHAPSPLGNPVLDQALAWVDCELHAEYDGGDHTIVVAAVRALSARTDAEPLLFFKGDYFGVQSRAGALESVA
jgi:3-hydroxy-9,10-secoandrosta-1,3,5(10)-triene-9,17-dione monooxygenase reductase component